MADLSGLTPRAERQSEFVRLLLIGLISFLTLVDLFAAQAILPSLTIYYGVSAASMGSAVNASTFGMAAAGLVVAIFARKISRHHGIWLSLAFLTVPTILLATCTDIRMFAILRVLQGVCMSTAFTLTMAYLAEEYSPAQAAGAMAAYITGNVGSNLLGRLIAANVVDNFGLSTSFYTFAVLNLTGAVIAYFFIRHDEPAPKNAVPSPRVLEMWKQHFSSSGLRAAFLIGFLILFAFLGVFTYINFVLASPRFGLSAAQLGLVYFVFIPSLLTTPFAGQWANRWGTRKTIWVSIIVTFVGLGLTLSTSLMVVLAGLAIVGAGTFCAQAATTGFVSGAAKSDRGGASGLYLTFYYVGGLAGSFLLGLLFDASGWSMVVVGVGVSLAMIMGLAYWLCPTLNVLEPSPELASKNTL